MERYQFFSSGHRGKVDRPHKDDIYLQIIPGGMSMSEDGVLIVAKLMEIAARTAPKAKGEDFIETVIIQGEEKDSIGREMIRIGEEEDSKGFVRDGKNVIDSDMLVIIGLLKHPGLGTDCAACGFDSCAEFASAESKKVFEGPSCTHRVADLGIAVGSAVKTASIHNVDNRIMYRAGIAAKSLGMIESRVAYGIPLAATGKNIFFDRRTT